MMEVDDEEIPTTPSGIDKYEDLNTAMTSLKTEIADQIADLKQIILSEQNKKISAPHPTVKCTSGWSNEIWNIESFYLDVYGF